MKILLLDDNQDLCLLMKEFLQEISQSEIKSCHSFEDFMLVTNETIDFDLAILDVNLGIGKKTGIDAYQWLIEHNFKGRFLFFSGHAGSYPILADLKKRPHVKLLEKPVSLEELEKVLHENF